MKYNVIKSKNDYYEVRSAKIKRREKELSVTFSVVHIKTGVPTECNLLIRMFTKPGTPGLSPEEVSTREKVISDLIKQLRSTSTTTGNMLEFEPHEDSKLLNNIYDRVRTYLIIDKSKHKEKQGV